MATKIYARIKDGKVWCEFFYDRDYVYKIKSIAGARFVSKEKGGPAWTVPLDFEIIKDLRRSFGRWIYFDDDLMAWGKNQQATRHELISLNTGSSATLTRLPEIHPELYRAVHVGPRGKYMSAQELDDVLRNKPGSYQTADVAFMARCANPMNTNQPGTGKTIETIATVFESGLHEKSKLIIAPLTSVDTVWEQELLRWGGGQPIITCLGDRRQRLDSLETASWLDEEGKPFWLIINPQMVQFQTVRVLDESGNWIRDEQQPRYPYIHDINWGVVVLDEFHKAGVTNNQTVTFKGLTEIKATKRIGLSGTPIGGKPIKLWGILHWLNPDEFTSKWRWAEQWLVIEESRFGKDIGDVRNDRRDAFNEHISRYIVRRTKAEVAPEMPAKQYIDLWVHFDPEKPKQAEQYRQMAEEAEARMGEAEDDGTLTATSILAEYTRLKQFADAYCTLGKYINKEGTKREVIPTGESCKLPHLVQILEERGIMDGEGDEQVVVFSQFSSMVDMLHDWFTRKKVPVAKLTGKTSNSDRGEIIRDFQSKDGQRPRVLFMTTTAGGVAITLDNASTVVFWDETWNPDDQEQAEDRVHRLSKLHQVTVYKIRTEGTIERLIESRLGDKQDINRRILDLRKEGLRAI